jgi:hypothetical protein
MRVIPVDMNPMFQPDIPDAGRLRDLRSGICRGRLSSVPLNGQLSLVGRWGFRLSFRAGLSFTLSRGLLFLLSSSTRSSFFRSPAKNHLPEPFDRGILMLHEIHQDQDESQNPFDLIDHRWLQIGLPESLDQCLNLSRISFGNLFAFGHQLIRLPDLGHNHSGHSNNMNGFRFPHHLPLAAYFLFLSPFAEETLLFLFVFFTGDDREEKIDVLQICSNLQP